MKLKRKAVLTTLVTLICVLTFSAISILIFAIYTERNKTTKNVNAADLVIYNATQLKSFIADVRGGNNYSGKTVELGASFTVGEIEPIGYYYVNKIYNTVTQDFVTDRGFNGKFDGKGFKLSNITVKGEAYTFRTFSFNGSTRQGLETYEVRTALFGNLGGSASVTNLWISRISYGGHGLEDLEPAPYCRLEIQGLAAAAIFTDCKENATFTNIRVDNPSGFTNGFGNGPGKVENCELRNSQGKGFGVKCNNCVFKQQSGYSCSTPFASGSSGCVSSANRVTGGTSWSSEGGSDHYTAWYAASGYNDGYPMLRKFISGWTSIYFTSSNTSYGTVNKSVIRVPSDASTAPFDDYNGSTSISVMIYSQSCGASKKENCEFIKWTYDAPSRTYTANFAIKDIKISFENGNADEFGDSSIGKIMYRSGLGGYETATTVSFKVPYGTSVTINFLTHHDQCDHSTSGNRYVVVQILFKGRKASESYETATRIHEVLFVLTSSDYYISSAQVTKSITHTYVTNQTITIEQETSFDPSYAIRDYDLGIV